MMKKIYTLLVLALLSWNLMAQIKKDRITYGIRTGVNFSRIALSGKGVSQQNKDDIKTLSAYYFGGNIQIPLFKSFYVQPGLSLTGKGFRGTIPQKGTEMGFSYIANVTGTRNIMYIELPVYAVYKLKSFYFGAGGYTGYAISGKDDFAGSAEVLGFTFPVERKKDLKFGNGNNDDLIPWDFGINFLAGYQLGSGTNIGLNYGVGLVKANTDKSKEQQASNRVFSILIGYSF